MIFQSLPLLALTLLAALWAPDETASLAPPAPLLRSERFVLEVPVKRRQGADTPPPARPIGFVEWRRRIGPAGDVLLERDTWFQEDGLRLRQTESWVPSETGEELVPKKMIWREQLGATEDGRPGLSRSLVFSPSRRPGEWTVLDRFVGRSDRSGLSLPESGPGFPLAMIEALREGRDPGTHRFSPLSKTIEAVMTKTQPGAAGQRVSEIRRPDGSLVVRLTFEGQELQAFRFQEQGVAARRVDDVEWRRLKDRLNASQ